MLLLLWAKARILLGCGKGQEAVKSYLEYSAMKKEYLGREVAGLNPLDLRGFWTRNREGVVDAPLFAGVADDASMGKVADGKTPEDALRMAADEIRQTHPLPYYWAPFVVMR